MHSPANKISWKGSSRFVTPANYVAKNEKLRLKSNICLTIDSSQISFYELFVNDGIIDDLYDQTKLYNKWRKLNSSSRGVKDVQKHEKTIEIGRILNRNLQ